MWKSIDVAMVRVRSRGLVSVGHELDQAAATVVEDGCRDRSHLGRGLREGHASGAEALVLDVGVVDGEGRQRDAVGREGAAVRGDGGVAGWFEE